MLSHHRSSRSRVALDGQWLFSKGHKPTTWLGGQGDDGDVVGLPHCWNATDTYAVGSEYYRGNGAYRGMADLPEPSPGELSGRWRLRSEGFYGRGALWVNGRRCGRFDGEYLGLDMDISRAAKAGESNIIGITLSNAHHRGVLPGIRSPDFILYGGLAGRVWIEHVPPQHIVEEAIRIQVQDVLTDHCAVRFQISTCGDERRACECVVQVEDPAGRPVGETCRYELSRGRRRQEIAGGIQLGAACLWSPSSPQRYTLTINLRLGDKVVDRHRVRFGCREAEFRPGAGFFLNGERCELRGVNRHESAPGPGNALSPVVHRQDAELIRSMGLNFVRLSHYPQHPVFLDACDDLGILVYAELASWKTAGGGAWLRAACRQFERMIRRDRNRPSVIAWGMGNEARHRGAYGQLKRLAHGLDPGRPVTYAENHLYRARRRRTIGLPDIWGLNYEFDALNDAKAASALKTTLVTECSNFPGAARSDIVAQREQVALMAQDFAVFRSRPEVAGFALWNFNDYATQRKQRYRRFCGVVDAWRRPKMSAAFLAASFSAELVLEPFIDPREHPDDTGSRRLDIMTNCEELQVLADGESVVCHGEAPCRQARVPAAAAEVRIIGQRGQATLDRTIYPLAKGTRLVLEMTGAHGGRTMADVVPFSGCVEDNAGHCALGWFGRVSVDATGSGDIVHYREDGSFEVAFGLFAGYLKIGSADGEIVITAKADGLRTGQCVIAVEG